nr:hypothetical protein [Tanacetum cinerariifolium]
MTLSFANTHNMVAYLNKSVASEGFDQIIDFLNGSYIAYALTVNPTIYISCIKQFWNTVVVKQSNDVTRLQALVDKKKVVVTEAAIRDALHLDDAEGVDCLPNEEIFTALARMGYEKPSTKLTFYKAFFSSQWKFLIHTILQSMSAKRTSWNEFSSVMASAMICLSTGKGCSGVETPLFEGMLVAREPKEQVDAEEHGNDDNAAKEPVTAVDDVAQDLEIIKLKTRVKKLEKTNNFKTLKIKRLRKVGTSQRVDTSNDTLMEDVSNQGRKIDELDRDKVNAAAVVTTAALVKVTVPFTRRRRGVVIRDRGVVIRDLEEESSAKTPTETKSKDKGKGIMVEEPKPIKKKQQVELDEAYARKLQKLNQDID